MLKFGYSQLLVLFFTLLPCSLSASGAPDLSYGLSSTSGSYPTVDERCVAVVNWSDVTGNVVSYASLVVPDGSYHICIKSTHVGADGSPKISYVLAYYNGSDFFTKDTVPASVSITSHADASLLESDSLSLFTLSGTCSENSATVSITGSRTGTTTCVGGSWTIAFDLSAETPGSNVTLTASHEDAASNGANDAVTMLIIASNSPPVVSISRPASGVSLVALGSTFSIDYSATDEDSIATTKLYYRRDSASGCDAGGITNWTEIAFNLPESANASYLWSSIGLDFGSYYLCAQANDEVNTVYSVSPGIVSIRPAPFITSWKTDNSGVSSSSEISLPLVYTGTYDFIVEWGDGSRSTIIDGDDVNKTHTYSTPGTYTVTIWPKESNKFSGWLFDNTGDRLKIINVMQWGSFRFGDTGGYFHGAANLTISATDVPDLSNTPTLRSAFEGCSSLTSVPNIANWNTENVTDMSVMFRGATLFNQDLSNWNTENVTNMSAMFRDATNFNNGEETSNLGSKPLLWNTSSLTNASIMFYYASKFNQPIGTWDVSKVTNMHLMFGSSAFNQDIGGWDTGRVTSMSHMFYDCKDFNQPIGNWNTSNVVYMDHMFAYSPVFNQDISTKITNLGDLAWDTSKVVAMNTMFAGAENFNQPIGNWNTGNVTNMNSMFQGAFGFNQPVSNWNTVKVTDMTSMFQAAYAFNQPIGNWDISSVSSMNMILFSTYSFTPRNYDQLLISWSKKPRVPYVTLRVATQYSSGASADARAAIISDSSWTILDGGPSTNYPITGVFGVASNILPESFTLNWTLANIQTATGGFYSVCSGSTPDAIDTVDDCLSSALVISGVMNQSSVNITNATPGQTYYYNVVVVDETGLAAVYSGIEVTTPIE